MFTEGVASTLTSVSMTPGAARGTPFGPEPITMARLLDEVELVIEDSDPDCPVTDVDASLMASVVRATVERLVDRGLLSADAVHYGGGLVLPNS